jgi:hypothetical protein
MARSRFLDYPRGRLLAVVDDAAGVDRARAGLRAAGFDDGDVEVLSGADAADRIDATGKRHGPLSRLVRAIQFGLMDQLPDLAWYEAALRSGHAVLVVRAADLAAARRAHAALVPAGAHFINHFGRFETADLEPWRGPEPAVSQLFKR